MPFFIKSGGPEIFWPDWILLEDEDTGEVVATEEVRNGLRVTVIATPCFPLWTTMEGLAAGGPAACECHYSTYSRLSISLAIKDDCQFVLRTLESLLTFFVWLHVRQGCRLECCSGLDFTTAKLCV